MRIREIINRISQLVHTIGMYFLIVMMVLTVVDVGGRYLLNKPVPGSYELTELLLLIIVFFGVAYTQLRKQHVSISFLADRFSQEAQAVLYSLIYFLGFGMFAAIAWQAILQASVMRDMGHVTEVLHLPAWPFLYVLSFGSAMLCLVLLLDLYDYLSRVAWNRGRSWLGLGAGLVLILGLFLIAICGRLLPWHLSPTVAGIVGIGVLLLFMFSGMPVGFAMGITGFLGMVYLSGIYAGFGLFRTVPYNESTSYSMSVIPLFILMGMFTYYSGLAYRLYWAGYKWLGRLHGGLAMATVAGCAGFAAVSGSSIATAATMGTVSLPEMKRYKYSDSLAVGAIAAGGTIGILIPPSVILIIYGLLVEESIGRLFIAGIIPGVLEALFYMVTIYILCKINPAAGPKGAVSTLMEKLTVLAGTWETLFLFLVVIGGIYMGVFTPNEAAGIGAFGAFLFAFARRLLTRENLKHSLMEAGTVTAMTIFIVIGAMMFGYFLSVSKLPLNLAIWISELQMNRYIIMALIILVYVILGCFMSAMAMILITIPIFYPVVMALGFNSIWFGILTVRVFEIAAVTPPYGMNLFVIKGVAKDVPIGTIYRGVVPFVIADLCHVALLVAFPQLATFLPSIMYGG